MPLQSKSQLRALFARAGPAVAKEFYAATPNFAALPERKGAAITKAVDRRRRMRRMTPDGRSR